MVIQSPYKKYKRGQRQANVETDFTSGMMFSEGAVSDGYVKTLVNFDFTQDGRNALKPRAALTVQEVILPDMSTELSLSDNALYLSDDISIKYSKECVENGVEYRQFILGKPDEVDGELQNKGKILAFTSPKSVNDFNDIVASAYTLSPASSSCAFYNTALTEIHGVELVPDAKTAFPVGSFMGNSFYFFDDSSEGKLKHTVFNADHYDFDEVEVKPITASEAVNYGYNMLDDSPYTFDDTAGAAGISFEMQGILPYDHKFVDEDMDDEWDEPVPQLLMNPRANSRIWFRCNYEADANETYVIKWSWKEVSADDWTVFNTEWDANNPFSSVGTPVLQADLIVPAKEILIRCEAYNTDDTTVVEKAMTVGFDFSLDPSSTTRNIKEEKYDLSTASGMMSWKNRLVLWGLPVDPTILFISDLDEPGYFPYPNNITVFDEPIISVVELMDTLIVFTKSKVHQVQQNDDGTTWTSTVIQSNLYIEAWDKHLIQSVRNMVYFKSGNYYYMIVPKAQSTTGELTLAPITTPITDFFNHFRVNVSDICKACFKTYDANGDVVSHDLEDMVTYYNFIDYDNIHNFYIYKTEYAYVHFDIIYNVVDRYWKINIYESAHFLYPFRNDATQNGLMAGTTLVNVINKDTSEEYLKRIIQIFRFDPLSVEDVYIIAGTDFMYSSDYSDAVYDANTEDINIPTVIAEYNSVVQYDWQTYIKPNPDPEYGYNYGEADPEYLYNEEYFYDEYYDHWNVSKVYDATIAASYPSYAGANGNLTVDSMYVDVSMLLYEDLTIIGSSDYISGFNRRALYNTIEEDAELLKDIIIFSNRQLLDTGYRDANLFINKRYRELQLQINNLDNVDMEFGMDFLIAGEPRNVDYKYEVSQVIDELREDEAIVYLDATPYINEAAYNIDKVNQWTLRNNLDYDISLWKVRAEISGKGVAPRLRLYTRSQFNYQLFGINWVYREMNMR